MKKDGHENVFQKKINQTKRYIFLSTVSIKVKDKLLMKQAMKTERGNKGTALLFL